MDFKTLIAVRQSCRNFSTEAVSKEDITACVEAARLAPSACNAQPMLLTVCTGDIGREVGECIRTMGMNRFTENVPCFLVVSESGYNLTSGIGSRLKDQDYRSIDIGIAAAHLTLAAAERGLATCILGMFDETKLRKLLGLKSRIRLVVALGYAAAGDPLRPKIRKKIDEFADFR
ncbi:MAG: NAD(P)H nitroreductase [Clostridia bacterium]|nr:NAD(P)H nitroreductase [Clostridia bacterium]